jgi:DDE family transposase
VASHSYQGLTGALVSWTAQLLPLLWERLQQRMEECGRGHWRVGRWLALAVDGSRISTPRTATNEKAFCAARYGKGKTAKYRKKKRKGQRRRQRKPEPVKPQIWTTLLWHMGMRLPWSWRNGPSNASERDHFRQMLTDLRFPLHTLFCGDAGFVGYEFWKAIIDGGHSFLMRVGANVSLLRRLGYVQERDGIVYFWPDKAAKKRWPPLVLRLFEFQVGRCRMSVVTNVLDEAQLSAEQARELYKLRWGIEVQFRTLKQTFGRRKLRSKTPERALVELDWSLLGLTMIQLFAVKEQIDLGEPPQRSSVALAIRLIREIMDRRREPSEPGADWKSRFRDATLDRYQRKRSKKARYRPKFKDKPKAGRPKIVTAKRKHKEFLQNYLANAA